MLGAGERPEAEPGDVAEGRRGESRLDRVRRHPAVAMAVLVGGLAVAGVVAPMEGSDLRIVQGGEMVLLALLRLALAGHFDWFFRALLVLGVALPLVGAGITPIYYRSGYRLGSTLEMAGIGLIPGLTAAAMGLAGRVRLATDPGAAKAPPPEGKLWWIEALCELSLWLMVGTLDVGEWSDLAVVSVGAGALGLVAGLAASLVYRSPLTRREVGAGLVVLGVATMVTSFCLVVFSNGRATEAVIGFGPALILILAGASMAGP